MANALYEKWKQELMQATSGTALNGSGATAGVFVALVTAGYTRASGDIFLATIAASPDRIVGTDQEIGATKTYADGTFDGADLTYTAVTGTVVNSLVGYVRTASGNTTWRLVFYFDTSVTGLPVTPNGGNITVTWAVGGIFTLSDADAKENIHQIGVVGVAKLYEYSYRGSQQREVGFIAQEVERYAPDAVHQFGKFKHVNYKRAIGKALQLAA